MSKKLYVSLVFVVLACVVLAGCGGSKYKMVGTWDGRFQGDYCTITFTSETNGTLIFNGSDSFYTLVGKKTGDKTFQATYGWQSEYGWQNRIIAAEFTSTTEFVARIINQDGDEIAAGVFNKR